jgi:hypothetical protein
MSHHVVFLILNKIFLKNNFHIHTVHLDTIKIYYSPTNGQVNVLKKKQYYNLH